MPRFCSCLLVRFREQLQFRCEIGESTMCSSAIVLGRNNLFLENVVPMEPRAAAPITKSLFWEPFKPLELLFLCAFCSRSREFGGPIQAAVHCDLLPFPALWLHRGYWAMLRQWFWLGLSNPYLQKDYVTIKFGQEWWCKLVCKGMLRQIYRKLVIRLQSEIRTSLETTVPLRACCHWGYASSIWMCLLQWWHRCWDDEFHVKGRQMQDTAGVSTLCNYFFPLSGLLGILFMLAKCPSAGFMLLHRRCVFTLFSKPAQKNI